MEGVINGRYYCNQNRTTELSNRMADRNKPNQHMQMFLVIDPFKQDRFICLC